MHGNTCLALETIVTEDEDPSDSDVDGSAEEQCRVADILAEALRDVPPEDAPVTLCRLCLRLLPVTGVSVSLQGAGTGTDTLLCASDAVSAQLAEIQYTLGEGPCLQARMVQAPVFAPDLLDARQVRRWPMFAAQAVRAGAKAVFSVPLSSPVRTLGTMDMYRREPGPLSDSDIHVALLAADAVNAGITAVHGSARNPEEVVAWLKGAETDREEVHQATGMIMVQLAVSPEEALARLRARAFAQGRTASELARDIVNRTSDIGDHD
ncbi:GAF and ANTAR domain-containing protein [Streptomyces sp. NBC_00289]|uniref:GAF and ANTAR domain-containing protein n=1 Tax=Streptomyces sp. NBC_00289 TaxID=2975703 RepID=UPI00324B8F4E